MLTLKGHDSLTQKRIHNLLDKVIDELSCSFFQVPTLLPSEPDDYEMKHFDMTHPVYIGMLAQSHTAMYPNILHEFISIWLRMWYYGFALYDFKLYIQPNGLITIANFEYTAFRMTEGPKLFGFPIPFETEDYIFEHPCFPQNFLQNLLSSSSAYIVKDIARLPYREKSETRNPA